METTKRSPRTNQDKQIAASRRREALVLELTRLDVMNAQDVARSNGEPMPDAPPLGYGRCARCRRNFPADRLEVDHVDGRRWDARIVNAWRRVARYWREFHAGVKLRALCRSCNGSDGATRRYGKKPLAISRRAT